MIRRFFVGSVLGFGILGLACSEDAGPNDASGGTTGTGAMPGSGGETASGGAVGSGGASSGGAGASTGTGGENPGGGSTSGGASSGGAGTGGGTAGTGGDGGGPPEPTLVTSAPGAYWQVGEVGTDAAGPATITVNPAGGTQRPWMGWGGTFNEKGWTALMALDETKRAEVMKLLFDDHEGIGFQWGRIPIGPSDYANERYTLSNAPGEFDITHDETTLIPYIKAAQAIKGNVKYWASPWTPPPWAKREDGMTENNGYDKGIFDTAHNQDYANFFVAWVDAYEKQGIPIDHVMPQNEPGWAQSYPTCAWGPARDSTNSTDVYTSETPSLGPFVTDFLKPALDATEYGTKIWFGTLSNNATFEDYWGSLADKSIVEGIALQWETVARLPQLGNVTVMQSEHKCGNYPWLGTTATSREDADRNSFLPDRAPNNYNYGVESWDLIKEWVDGGINIYSAWNMVLDTGGFNLDEVRAWPQNSMIAVDVNAGTYEVTPYYYVFRHVAQYAEAGGKSIGVTGHNNSLAWENGDGSVVLVVFNSGGSEAAHTADINGTLVSFTVPAGGWATVNWAG